MKNQTSKLKDVIRWPEFQVVWGLLIAVIVEAILNFFVHGSWVPYADGALLLVVFVLSAASVYYSAKTDRDTSVTRNELKSILGSLGDALIVYEADFRVIFFNPAAERIFKLDAKAVLGHVFSPRDVERDGWRTLIQIVFPSLAPRVVPRSKEGEYPQVVDISFTDPALEFRVTTAPVTDEHGNPLAFMKIIQDRTPQILALRSKSEFVTVASHQLRGPVTDISWALQSLSGITGLDETNKAILDHALAASQSLLRRIEDLLDIAKMEDGQFGYKFEDTDISDFIVKVLSDVLPAAQKAGVKIYFDRPSEALPHVMIDPRRLTLAVTNLLENAVRYNVENGEVTVRVDKMQDKPFVVVSVKDTGIGIPPEAMEKLFNKFYRADNALKRETEGSGLGLYIAKGIVNAHGGQIWAQSELNRGTTISFALPTDPNLVPKTETGGEDYF
ncbi:MAG TPA: ATP-binding protein [Candidatus Paceibacterota bacterium]|nr:ATP-binding protein [Candidatus Paceibacterota bacterium]